MRGSRDRIEEANKGDKMLMLEKNREMKGCKTVKKGL